MSYMGAATAAIKMGMEFLIPDILRDGLQHYARKFTKAINGSSEADAILIVAILHKLAAQLSTGFDEADQKMLENIEGLFNMITIDMSALAKDEGND